MYRTKICNFIDIDKYKETFETNLNKDEIARSFWAKQIPLLIVNFCNQALESDKTNDIDERVEAYRVEYQNQVDRLLNNPNGFLSVRMLLELNELLLKKHDFKDLWKAQKSAENLRALKVLNKRLAEIDRIDDFRKRWEELFRGVLAGNIFDSGATAVQEILTDNINFGLDDALVKIPQRPWLIDSFDQFMRRLDDEPHACAAFFCDNSGVDIVLGVLPFVREFLRRKTKVILCANSEPSLNDVTYPELLEIVDGASRYCPIISQSLSSQNLIVAQSGQKGCCLNFLNIDEELLNTMLLNKTDLIIIEGMGRSLHTNLNSTFKCESLKLAVIKNKFLASRLGGNLFDAICKFENSCSSA